jgi:hypothetical protein
MATVRPSDMKRFTECRGPDWLPKSGYRGDVDRSTQQGLKSGFKPRQVHECATWL